MPKVNGFELIPRYVFIMFLIMVFFAGIYFIFLQGKNPEVVMSSFMKTPRPTQIVPTFTMSPTTIAPETMAPETIAPETIAPETIAPETMAPTPMPFEEDEEDEEDDQDDQDDNRKNEDDQNNEGETQLDEVKSFKPDNTDLAKCPDMLIRQGNTLLLYNSKMPEVPGKNPIRFNSLDEYIYYIKVQRYKYGQHCPVLYLQQESNAQGEDVYRVRPGPFNQEAGLPIQGSDHVGEIGKFFGGNLGRYANPAGLPGQPGPYPFNRTNMPNAVVLSSAGAPISSLIRQPTIQSPPLVPYVDASHQGPYNKGYYGFDPTGQNIGQYTILDEIHSSTQRQNPKTGLSSNPMDPNWAGIAFTQGTQGSMDFVGAGNFPQSSGPRPSSTMAPTKPSPTLQAANSIVFNQATLMPSKQMAQSQLSQDNPMNANWAGVKQTNVDVASGQYSGSNLLIRTA